MSARPDTYGTSLFFHVFHIITYTIKNIYDGVELIEQKTRESEHTGTFNISIGKKNS